MYNFLFDEEVGALIGVAPTELNLMTDEKSIQGNHPQHYPLSSTS